MIRSPTTLFRGARARCARASAGLPTIAAATILAACVSGPADGSTCGPASVSVDLALTGDGLSPSDPRACRGQQVTLLVAVEADGVLHIHGYDDAVPATPVEAGAETRLEFEAIRAGQFPIEFHPADDPPGIEVGILTVDEP